MHCGEERPPEEMETEGNPEMQQDLHRIYNPKRKKKPSSGELRMKTSPGEELSSADWAHPGVGRGVSEKESLYEAENDVAKRETRIEIKQMTKQTKGKQKQKSCEKQESHEQMTRKQFGCTSEPGSSRGPARILTGAWKGSPTRSGRSPGLESWEKAEPSWIQFGPERPRSTHSCKAFELPKRRGAWQKESSFYRNLDREGKVPSPIFKAVLKDPNCYPESFKPRAEGGNIIDWEKNSVLADNCLSGTEQAELLLQDFKEFLELKAGRQSKLHEDNSSVQSEDFMQVENALPLINSDDNSMDCSICCKEIAV